MKAIRIGLVSIIILLAIGCENFSTDNNEIMGSWKRSGRYTDQQINPWQEITIAQEPWNMRFKEFGPDGYRQIDTVITGDTMVTKTPYQVWRYEAGKLYVNTVYKYPLFIRNDSIIIVEQTPLGYDHILYTRHQY